jgi:hypothetical protein
MRLVHASAVAIAVALFIPAVHGQQAQDADRKVAGGGITAKGWQGMVDPGNKQGLTITDSKFAAEGSGFRITTGAAGSYWNPSNVAKGDYTIKATFREPKQTYNHPHPYGLFIGGRNLNTDKPSMIYCVAYRDGNYLVRQFADGAVTTIVRRAPNAAVNKATGPDAEVTQEVSWAVKGKKAECSINGTVVHTIDLADAANTVKVDSFDGTYGIRLSHNSEIIVSNITASK